MDIFHNAQKLGFGLMRLPLTDPNDAGSIDIEQVKQMVDTFLARGFTYFDTAWMYCAFKSEDAVKAALTSRHPRGSFTLADKLHAGFLHSKEDRDQIFNTQLQKTGAGPVLQGTAGGFNAGKAQCAGNGPGIGVAGLQNVQCRAHRIPIGLGQMG